MRAADLPGDSGRVMDRVPRPRGRGRRM